MPQRRQLFKSTTASLVLLAAALGVLNVMPSRRRKTRVAPRRLAASLAFATLFFAGAAFSAGAGNTVAQLLEPGDESALMAPESATTSTEEDPAADSEAGRRVGGPTDDAEEAPASEAPPAEQPDPPAEATPAPSADDPAPEPDSDGKWQPAVAAPAASDDTHASVAPKSGTTLLARTKPSKWAIRQNAFRRSAPPVLAPRPLMSGELNDTDPEVDEPGVTATVWLHRKLPDPTPPARRLKPSFAGQLARTSARAKVDWALVLGVLRASGKRGAAPASPATLRTLSNKLAKLGARRNPWSAVLALEGQTAFADRAIALQRYNRAVGLRALVKGLEAAKPSISKRILLDERISIYPGGRVDIQAGRVNIRILVLIAYLAEAHGQASVSSLISGHRLYSRPGVVSAHIYGLAADISVLGGLSILGNSQPGGMTEAAVRNVLLLPAELQPRQVISLLGMGGPSFPMGNHDDHIHVGY